MKFKTSILDTSAVNRAVMRLSHEILEKNAGCNDVVLVGIKTRGVPFAQMIAENIFKLEKISVPVEELDITLYRDDLSELGEVPTVNDGKISVPIKNKHVILCDDVLFTGRTARAGIDAVMQNGRPKTIQLAILVDRGHRELPIRADYVGKNLPTALNEIVAVKFDQTDGETKVDLYVMD